MSTRQITDARAPFADIDTALDVGHEHMRAMGWSPVAIVAEEQTGGYFARIVGQTRINKGRSSRNRWESHTAEIGRINPHERVGRDEGDLCRRGSGCTGRIEVKPVEGCTCHISAPCWRCEEAPFWCPTCEWRSDL